MQMRTRARRRALAVAAAVVLGCVGAAAAVGVSARTGHQSITGCPGSPTRHAVIEIRGQATTAELVVYLRHGQACASVHGPSRDAVGVALEACANTAGAGLPGTCTSTLNTNSGQMALHKLGVSVVQLAAPSSGYVIARGFVGDRAGNSSVTITIPVGLRS